MIAKQSALSRGKARRPTHPDPCEEYSRGARCSFPRQVASRAIGLKLRSDPADRREGESGIKRIGSLPPGNQGFGYLLQLLLRRPALRNRQLSEHAAQPNQVVLRDSARLLERASRRSGFRGHGARRLSPREACLSKEGTQLERSRRTARGVLALKRPQPVPLFEER